MIDMKSVEDISTRYSLTTEEQQMFLEYLELNEEWFCWISRAAMLSNPQNLMSISNGHIVKSKMSELDLSENTRSAINRYYTEPLYIKA